MDSPVPATATDHPLIQLRGVSKAFGGKPVLNGVDLTIHPGEALGIIGPSGTGKSTVLRLIAGLLLPDGGEVVVQGQRRTQLIIDATDPLLISLVFQQAALFDSLSVGENVGFLLYREGRLPREEIARVVRTSLERVGLPDIAHLYPAELSGGMRKRVSFARAIVHNFVESNRQAELLLYDEPTAGLDPIASTVVEDLMRDLRQIQTPGSAYVVVTHQESTIRRATDRIVMLYDGRVCWAGPTADIDRTDNIYVRQFFSGAVSGPIQVAS